MYISSPDPELVLAGLNGCRDLIATHHIYQWRARWRSISYLYIIWISKFHWGITVWNVHAEKIQLDCSANGLCDGVEAVCIIGVIARVGWGGEDAIWGCETASTCTKVIAPIGHISWFICKLKSKATLKRVGDKSERICKLPKDLVFLMFPI